MENQNTTSWEDSISKIGQSMTRFFAKHGATLGLSGGVVLSMAATANLISGAQLPTAELVEANQAASTAMFIGGILKMGAMTAAQTVARIHLRGVESLFENDDQQVVPDPRSSHGRGAETVDDEVLSNPLFQRAMQEYYADLQSDPKTRAETTEFLRSNPDARRSLMQVQEHIEAARERAAAQKKQGGIDNPSQFDSEDDAPSGPSYH